MGSGTEGADQALVRRAQAGDRAAFGRLVGKYRTRIMKLAMRYMHNHEDAEDTVQEIFIRAYGGLSHFRGQAEFYSWLHRIAINAAKSALQSRRRSAVPNPEELHEYGAIPARMQDLDTPEDLASTDQICVAVNAAIDSLCVEQRIAIELRELDGLSYAQVACAMACPIGTVRSRVFRAREAIDHRLRRQYVPLRCG
ncbi:MAG TPA: sigma-70 family RNA polymerase sigma factor [Steroidobacteraceae bacterium]|jgi:RNA polymerase sigma-70 factor (ECF subfamily)